MSLPCSSTRCCARTFSALRPSSRQVIRCSSSAAFVQRQNQPSRRPTPSSPSHKSSKSSRRWESTAASAAAPIDPKISSIVDQISQLTLLETADLVSSLKVRPFGRYVHHSLRVFQRTVVQLQSFQARAFPNRLHSSPNSPLTSIPPISCLLLQTPSTNQLNSITTTKQTRLNIPDTPLFAPSSASAGPGGASAPSAAAAAEEEDLPAPAAAEKTLFTLTLKSIEATAKPKVIKEVKQMLGLSLVDSKKFVESAPKMMREGVPKEEAEKIIETLKGVGGVVTME